MATTLLKLVNGDPSGKSSPQEYQFEPITLDGDLEQTILAEIATYQLKCTTDFWVDHDEYGRYLDDTSVSYQPLTNFVEHCFVCDGHLAGAVIYSDLHFITSGVKLGSDKSYHSWWVNSRRMDNSVSEYQLVKIEKQ